MYRLGAVRLARVKGGQRAWSPNTGAAASSASTNTNMTGAEVAQMVYRPLPLQHTVDYEEDFYDNIMVQREYVPPTDQKNLSFDMAPLAHSKTEMVAARRRLAGIMNTERNGSTVSGDERNSPIFQTSSDDEAKVGDIAAARYVFDEPRIKYCERFARCIDEQRARRGIAQGGASKSFTSIMEACAVVYGCTDDAAKESWFRRFMSLDTNSLEADAEEQLGLEADLRDTADVARWAEGDVDDEGELNSEHHAALPSEFTEFAPLYNSYGRYCSGQAPVYSGDYTAVESKNTSAERLRWRQLLDRLVREDYHLLTPRDHGDIAVLNDQLHTVKLFDMRVGESVKEALQLHQRLAGGGVSHQVDGTGGQAVTHPERREGGSYSEDRN
jgi:hypothetical protein